jgi:hypothetical protein
MGQAIAVQANRVRAAGTSFVAGGAGWVLFLGFFAAFEATVSADRGVFTGFELGFVAVHLLLFVRLIRLWRSGEAAGGLGTTGLGLAILGRIVFLAAEIQAIAMGHDETLLLPAAAMLTAVGMVLAGVAVTRGRRWTGWKGLTPLIVGLYPFVFMFPLVIVTTEPNYFSVAGWGLPWIALGVAMRDPAEGTLH